MSGLPGSAHRAKEHDFHQAARPRARIRLAALDVAAYGRQPVGLCWARRARVRNWMRLNRFEGGNRLELLQDFGVTIAKEPLDLRVFEDPVHVALCGIEVE